MVATFDQFKKAYSDVEKELFISVVITEQVFDAEAQASEHFMRAVKLLVALVDLRFDRPASKVQDLASIQSALSQTFTQALGKEKAEFCFSIIGNILNAKDSKSTVVSASSLVKVQKCIGLVLNAIYSDVKKENGKTCCAYFKKHKKLSIGVAAVAVVILINVLVIANLKRSDASDGFEIVSASQDYGYLAKDVSIEGEQLRIADVPYDSGYATHANAEIEIKFAPKYKFFSGLCGMQDFDPPNPAASARCKIISGNNVLFASATMRQREPAVPFKVSVDGLSKLVLIVDDADDGNSGDHVNWVNLKLE